MNILASLTENVTTFTSILKPLQHKCHFLCRPAYSESLFSLFAVWLFCHCNLLWGENNEWDMYVSDFVFVLLKKFWKLNTKRLSLCNTVPHF